MIKRLKNEAGYTLVEVMVAIAILTIAIIPMTTMIHTGLEAAATNSNLDIARTLANLKLEQAKTIPFDSSDAAVQDLKDNFPGAAGTTTTYDGSGNYQSAWMAESGAASADFTDFEYMVEKQYVTPPSSSGPFATSNTATDMIRVTVSVRWGSDIIDDECTTYCITTSGLVAR